jgi:hypothetical protein
MQWQCNAIQTARAKWGRLATVKYHHHTFHNTDVHAMHATPVVHYVQEHLKVQVRASKQCSVITM